VTSQPTATSPANTPTPNTGQFVAAADSGEIGRGSPFGKIPVKEKEARRMPTQRGSEGDVPPAAACEQIDGRGQEWQETAEEDELDRPSADEPLPRPDVRLGPARDVGRLVERAQERLGGSPELVHPLLVEGHERVALGIRGAGARGAQRDSRGAPADERGLAIEAERKREVDQLGESVGTLRRRLALRLDARLGGGDKGRGWCARRVAGEMKPWNSVPADRVQVDDRREPVAEARVARELGRAERAEDVSVRADEDERV
jgi:hypothetical protein